MSDTPTVTETETGTIITFPPPHVQHSVSFTASANCERCWGVGVLHERSWMRFCECVTRVDERVTRVEHATCERTAAPVGGPNG
jgi:hypothetical protein